MTYDLFVTVSLTVINKSNNMQICLKQLQWREIMKVYILILSMALLMQSCCIYRSSTGTGDYKISEFGIAPYKARPSQQIETMEIKK